MKRSAFSFCMFLFSLDTACKNRRKSRKVSRAMDGCARLGHERRSSVYKSSLTKSERTCRLASVIAGELLVFLTLIILITKKEYTHLLGSIRYLSFLLVPALCAWGWALYRAFSRNRYDRQNELYKYIQIKKLGKTKVQVDQSNVARQKDAQVLQMSVLQGSNPDHKTR